MHPIFVAIVVFVALVCSHLLNAATPEHTSSEFLSFCDNNIADSHADITRSFPKMISCTAEENTKENKIEHTILFRFNAAEHPTECEILIDQTRLCPLFYKEGKNPALIFKDKSKKNTIMIDEHLEKAQIKTKGKIIDLIDCRRT